MKYEVTLTKAFDYEIEATTREEALQKAKDLHPYGVYTSEVQEVEE